MENKKETEQFVPNIFDLTEKYLAERYEFRFNEIALEIECTPKNANRWASLNENGLYIELQKKGIKISIQNLIAILRSEYVKTYNPIKEYFLQLPKWDGKTLHI